MDKPRRLSLEERILAGGIELEAFPAVYRKLLQVLDNPYASPHQVARVVGADPSLSARLLRMANSVYYGSPGRIASVQQAVQRVGMEAVRSLAVCLASYDSFFAGTERWRRCLWERSLATAFLAEGMARAAGEKGSEGFFVAGLLHDVGKPLMERYLPGTLQKVERLVLAGMDECEAERRLTGTDHARLGGLACRAWRLPAMLPAIVEAHHRPLEASDWTAQASLLHLASLLANRLREGGTGEETAASDVWTVAGILPEEAEAVLPEASRRLEGFRRYLEAA